MAFTPRQVSQTKTDVRRIREGIASIVDSWRRNDGDGAADEGTAVASLAADFTALATVTGLPLR